jgi:spermidine synthase
MVAEPADEVQAPGVARTLALAFVLSGGAGLIHEVVWTRLLGFLFGVSEMAIATVLVAFMGGLALGSWWIGARGGGTDGRRTYAWLEIGIGVIALAIPVVLGLVEPVYGWLWRRFHFSFAVFSVLRFLLAGSILLAPTILMGATFPVLAGYADTMLGRRLRPQWLYTANLAGAVLGVGTAGFVLLPAIGVRGTILVGALVNIGVGLWILRLPAATPAAPRPVAAAVPGPLAATPRALLLTAAFLSGLVSLASQVAWTRVLALVVGSTTYAFTAVLLVFLVALGIGSALAAWRASWAKDIVVDLALMHGVVALLLLKAIGSADGLPYLSLWLDRVWGPGAIGGIVVRSLCTTALLLFPSVVAAGTLLPLALIALLPPDARETGPAVGRVYAINTLGAIAGAVLAGFVLVPGLGTQRTLIALALATAAMGLALALGRGRPGWLVPVAASLLVVAGAGAVTRQAWSHRDLHAGVWERGRDAAAFLTDESVQVLYQREGRTASVLVYVSDPNPQYRVRTLKINARANASDAPPDLSTQVLLAHLPLLVAPRTDRVFVVGWGSGVTVGSAALSKVRQITAVELEPAVVEASHFFDHVNHEPLRDPRVRLYEDDARHILLASTDIYDVIISEPSHPWVAGVANLFTRDFYALAARRLAPDGVFAQWLQTYRLSGDTYRAALAAFHAVFPQVLVFGTPGPGDTVLVGSRAPLRVDLLEVERRWQDARVQADLARIGFRRPEYLFACLYLGPEAVSGLVRDVPPNTDDNMYVEFRGARDMASGVEAAALVESYHPELAKVVASLLVDRTVLDGSPARRAALVEALERIGRDPSPWKTAPPG